MINRNQLRLSRLTLGLIAALATAPAFAQSTSASVVGQVSSDDGRPVAGQQVTILHTESGTVSRPTTHEAGRYPSSGLRVGCPSPNTLQRAGHNDTVTGALLVRRASDAQPDNGEPKA